MRNRAATAILSIDKNETAELIRLSAWINAPIERESRSIKIAYAAAIGFPRAPRLPSSAPIIPFPRRPASPTTTHSEYFTAIAKTDETKSQKTLPAPPSIIPRDTPYIFPTPRVPARARNSDLLRLRSEINFDKRAAHLIGCRMKKKRRLKSRMNPTITVRDADKRLIVHIFISVHQGISGAYKIVGVVRSKKAPPHSMQGRKIK
jgi:hypothetical protein